MYVGRLDTNKNILNTLKETDFSLIQCFTIVGDGELYQEIKHLAMTNPKIKMFGRLSNKDSLKVMATHDFLILPSLYDGWGAVVNEALSTGTRVLCSDACGASILLDGKARGESFTQKDKIAKMQKWYSGNALTLSERNEIIEWASRHISGKAAAEYFVKSINGKSVTAPWIQ